MAVLPRLDIVGAALGDQSRVRILCELMDVRSHTGKELACAVGIAPNTASEHLQRLREAGLIASVRHGRTIFHQIASSDVADLLEQISVLSPIRHPQRPLHRGPQDICLARSCYNHLAGRLGVLIADQLQLTGVLVPQDAALVVDPDKASVLVRLGLWEPQSTAWAKLCLDWTERQPHLSGPIAIGLLELCLRQNWLQRRTDSRALTITPQGHAAFQKHFNLSPEAFVQATQTVRHWPT